MVTPGTRLARRTRRARAHYVATEERLHEGNHHEGHEQHEEAEHGDGSELPLLLEIEDDDGHDLGAGGEEDDGRGQLADDPDEDEAPRGDDAALRQGRGDLAE